MTTALAAGLLAGCGGDDDEADGDGSGDDVEAFCAEAEDVVDSFADLQGVSEPTPELFQEVSDAFGTLADDAPEEIRGDMETLVAGLSALGDVLEEVDPDDPTSLTALTEEIERLEAEGDSIEEAGANVEAYLSDECGIDLSEAGEATEGATDGATEDPAADETEAGEPSEGG